MFGYFVRYFIARASYDAMRAGVRRRSTAVGRAQAQENLRQANERLRLAKAKVAALRAPTLDNNLLAIGRQHASLGMKLSEVETCYGEGEELPSPSNGVTLRAYRLNAFSLRVSFWKGRSFQESWTKEVTAQTLWQSGEILALLENKTPGHLWTALKSSSKQLNWWASPLGLVGCFEIREAGQALLHIADPKYGAPSTMPSLPAAALPAPLPEALPGAGSPEKPVGRGCVIVGLAVAFFVLYSLYRTGSEIDANHSRANPIYTPSFTPAPAIQHALPVTTPPAYPTAPTPPPSSARALPVETSATEHSYSVVGIAGGDTLNVHSGPGSKFSSIAKLPRGTNNIRIVGASVMNDTTEWVHISFGNHSGWVVKQYLKAD